MDNDPLNIWTTTSVVKEIVLWFLPFLLLHFYLQRVYQLSLLDIPVWWVKNYSTTDSPWMPWLFFVLFFVFLIIPLSGLINVTYLKLFGEPQRLVYLGNHAANNSHYYNVADTEKRVFEGYNIDRRYNFSFSNVNRVQQFTKDPGTSGIVGLSNRRLHPLAIIGTLCFLVFSLILAAGGTHVVAYPVYLDIQGTSAQLQGETMDAFVQVLQQFGISKAQAAIGLFGSVILAVAFSIMMPSETLSEPVTPLPNTIRPEATIKGIPLTMDVVMEKRKRADDREERYDSGLRQVVYRFEQDFDPAIYVTMTFDSFCHAGTRGNHP